MGELETLLEEIRVALAAALPARVVTRGFSAFGNRKNAELEKGVFTLITQGMSRYTNRLGREAGGGVLRILLVGQIHLGNGSTGSQVEAAEFALVEEVITFLRSGLTGELGGLILRDYSQSGQQETPYGWVAINLELQRV